MYLTVKYSKIHTQCKIINIYEKFVKFLFIIIWKKILFQSKITNWVVNRGVHGSDWVGLRGFFDPTHHDGSKKIQPNPHRSGWIWLNPWV